MRIQAIFPFVDETVNVIVEMSNETEQDRSAYVTWEYPLCKTQLARPSQSLDVGCLSLMELLGFLHLPLRRNLWPQFENAELGDYLLDLHVGSFAPEEGSTLHQMTLRRPEEAEPDFRMEFSEHQAEQWAVAIWEISERLQRFQQSL